ncbi:hypothetical protein, partial [Cedecea sp. NFIX57]|uniref:hypothetical protein n=1 Tax=Cedecea sp. NFIX57 TaxID=1566286 RepID=UPI003F8D003F
FNVLCPLSGKIVDIIVTWMSQLIQTSLTGRLRKNSGIPIRECLPCEARRPFQILIAYWVCNSIYSSECSAPTFISFLSGMIVHPLSVSEMGIVKDDFLWHNRKLFIEDGEFNRAIFNKKNYCD